MLFETLSNPLIKLADVPGICAAAREVGALSIVDSTFTPPPLIQPLAHGADIVIHSATKYIGGHGDVMGGLVTVADTDRVAALRQISKLAGSILGPFEAFLIARGLRTLVLRVTRQSENAAALAQWLSEQPQVAKVHYPGLPTHPQHALAERLLARPYWGAMLAFEITGRGICRRNPLLRCAQAGPPMHHPWRHLHRGILPADVEPPRVVARPAPPGRHHPRRGARLRRHRGYSRHNSRLRAGAGVVGVGSKE